MKPIKGFDKYSITENGEVWSHSHKKFMKFEYDDNGYKTIRLISPGVYKKYKIHRLVALTFLDNPMNKKCVNHINGIKTDNRLENLEWNTHSENIKHAYKLGLNKSTKKRIISVINSRSKMVVNLENGICYESLKIASIENGYKNSILSKQLNNIVPNKTTLIYV